MPIVLILHKDLNVCIIYFTCVLLSQAKLNCFLVETNVRKIQLFT